MAEEGSAVFTGHRPLGYVSNHVPLVTRYITRRCAASLCSEQDMMGMEMETFVSAWLVSSQIRFAV
jgi:hypothetical protein